MGNGELRRAVEMILFYGCSQLSLPEHLNFYLTCGDQEGLLPANRIFGELLEKHHFKYEFHSGPGGHDWNQWNSRLQSVFDSLLLHLGV